MAPGRAEATHAVIRNLYKLMAYKDEYEVARLHLKPAFHAGTRALFAAPRRVTYHLHPPLLRALGLEAEAAARTLVPARAPGAAGAPAAPRDAATTRSATRRSAARSARLVPWYRGLVMDGARRRAGDAHATALELARLPDGIRGYEDIKLRSIAKVRGQALTLTSKDPAAAIDLTGSWLHRRSPSLPPESRELRVRPSTSFRTPPLDRPDAAASSRAAVR